MADEVSLGLPRPLPILKTCLIFLVCKEDRAFSVRSVCLFGTGGIAFEVVAIADVQVKAVLYTLVLCIVIEESVESALCDRGFEHGYLTSHRSVLDTVRKHAPSLKKVARLS